MKIMKPVIRRDSRVIVEKAEALKRTADIISEGLSAKSAADAIEARALEDLRPETVPTKIMMGQPADAYPMNAFFKTSYADLTAIDKTVAAMSKAIASLHNVTSLKLNEADGLLNTAFSRLAAMSLYKESRDAELGAIAYDFQDGGEITASSTASILEDISCLTLPVKSATQVRVQGVTVMRQSSNGVAGNNRDRNRPRNGIVENVIDGDQDSWFEYESIDASGDLTLVLELVLSSTEVVNQLRISPVNFSSGAPFIIERIELKVAGVYNEISASHDLLSMASDRVLTGRDKVIAFFPSRASSIRISLRQPQAYMILDGRYTRRAIGLKEVAVERVEYDATANFELTRRGLSKSVSTIGAKAVLLDKPYGSRIKLEASADGGVTFKELSMLDDDLPGEVVELNRLTSELIVRGTIERDKDSFMEALKKAGQKLEEREELTTIPSVSSPVQLLAEPADNVAVMLVGDGRMGQYGEATVIGQGRGQTGAAQVIYLAARYRREALHLMIDGVEWEQVESFTGAAQKAYIYNADAKRPHIILGDGNPEMMAGSPAGEGSLITIEADADKLITMRMDGDMVYVKPSMTLDKVKGSTRVFRRDMEGAERILKLRAGETMLDASVYEIAEVISVWNDNGTYIAMPFIDGRQEFDDNSQYSLSSSGVFYISAPADVNTYFKFREIPKNEIENWTFSLVSNEIAFDRVYAAITSRSQAVEEERGRNYIDLDILPSTTLIQNSIRVDGSPGSDMAIALERELDYVDGITEFDRLDGEKLGYYSVDYSRRRLMLPPVEEVSDGRGGVPAGSISFDLTGFEIHYGVGRQLEEGRDYTVDGSRVMITPSAIMMHTELNALGISSGRLLVRYTADTSGLSATDDAMATFFSPLIDKLVIFGNSIDPRLTEVNSEDR